MFLYHVVLPLKVNKGQETKMRSFHRFCVDLGRSSCAAYLFAFTSFWFLQYLSFLGLLAELSPVANVRTTEEKTCG